MKTVFLIIFLFFVFSSEAQFTGLWQVEKVTVGNNAMTPVAKWFLFTDDLKSYSGNGGIQNSKGTYSFDKKKSEFLFYDSSGIADEFGPFTVEFYPSKMTWTRSENGENVEVFLLQTDEKPEAPWDKITGNWLLASDESKSIYFFWDGGYRARNGLLGENQFGIWQINGHRPELKLASDQGDKNDSSWDIFFEDGKMIWVERQNENPQKLIFKRNNE